MEIKALSMAGSGPELSSYFPWRGQGKREEAAAVVSPLGVVLGFTFISPQRRGAGEGSKKKKKDREEKGENWYIPQERAVRRGQGRGGPRQRQESQEWSAPFCCSALAGIWHPVSSPVAPPRLSPAVCDLCNGFTHRVPWK